MHRVGLLTRSATRMHYMKKSTTDTGSEQQDCILENTSGVKPAATGTPTAVLAQLPIGRGGSGATDLKLADDEKEPERYRVAQEDKNVPAPVASQRAAAAGQVALLGLHPIGEDSKASMLRPADWPPALAHFCFPERLCSVQALSQQPTSS